MPLGKNADAGDYVKDFQKSDAPQFKGKSKEKRRKMAIAAYLDSKEKKESKMKSFSDIRAQISEQRTAADCAGMVCKNCGDVYGQPTESNCMYDSKDPNGKNWVEKVEESKVLDNMSQLPKGMERPLKSMQQVKKDADLGGMKITHIVKNKQGTKVVAAVVSNGKKNFVYVNNKGVAPLKEGIKYTHAVTDRDGKVAGMASNEKDAKDIARRHKGKVVRLKKPMSDKKGDMMINRTFSEAKQTHMFDNEKDARAKAKEIGGKYVKGTGKSAGKHAAIKEGKKMDSAAMKRAMDAFKKRGGKVKKVAPGKAAGYHGKDDPGADVQGMMDRGDTKGMPRKKKIRSMR